MDRVFPEKSFSDCFSKLSYEDLPGELLQCLSAYSYEIDKVAREMHVFLQLGETLKPELLLRLQNRIAQCYSLNACTVTPQYDASLFSEEALRDLLPILCDRCAIDLDFFAGAQITLTQTDCSLKLVAGYDALPRAADSEQLFSALIHEVFGKTLSISFGAAEFDLTDYNRETDAPQIVTETLHAPANAGLFAKESTLAHDEENPMLITVGYYTFDLSAPELLYGKKPAPGFAQRVCAIGKTKADGENYTVCGKLFYLDVRESKKGTRGIVSLYVTDDASSLSVKIITSPERAKELSELSLGETLLVEGTISPDDFDNGEPTCKANTLCRIREVKASDTAKKKRVELHLHTNMSALDALPTARNVLQFAADLGHTAVAITDHGNVQSFPMALDALKKIKNLPENFKILYGMEGYFVDDTARALFGEANLSFADGDFVLFDLETTGLSPLTCAITQIGAVRLKNGEITERFSTFVNPGMPIPQNITELTGITDEMVADAPSPPVAVRDFLAFCADSVLVAHNAPFDIGFLKKVCDNEKIPFTNSYLDTVALSRYLNADLKRHSLDALADYFSLGGFNHHRATDDTEMLVAIFLKMTEKLRAEGILTTDALSAAMGAGSDPRQLPVRHITLLVQNETGLKNLYKLVSYSYLNYFRYHPRIPKTVLSEHREGLLIGSACEAGELYHAVVEGKGFGELLKIADFYDYFEIQPLSNNAFMIQNGTVESEARIIEFNKTVLSIAKKQNKPCCATGDVHFLKRQDGIYRQILQYGMKFSDAMRETPLYYRTTEEMLAEFSYLSPADAKKVVVDDPNSIAERISPVRPIPKGLYPPRIEGADDELENACYTRAKELFGDPLPALVAQRLERELRPIIKHGFAVLYVTAKRLVKKSEDLGYLVGSRGSVGSSFVATLSGITEVNPLPPYYLCPKCKFHEFIDDGSVGSGFDLPARACPKCGEMLMRDGQNIPFETFLGFDGDKEPDIDLNFSGNVQSVAHQYTEELFGKENAFRAGTISTIAERTAFGFVKKFVEENHHSLSKAALQRLAVGCSDVKRTTGQHPGGIIVIPRDKEIYDFTPVQHPADKTDGNIITTHFPYDYLHETIYKLDILGHDVPTKYKMLEEYTDTRVLDVPMNDEKVMGLLLSPEPLGVSAQDIGFATGTLALPELGTPFVCGLLQKTKPRCFSDLLQISGLSHGTGVWLGNAEELVQNGTCTVGEVIGTRDGIMVYLMQKGLDKKLSFDIMECVRKKNKSLTEAQEDEMRAHNVPEWYIASCKKITYLFPKAHAAAYIIAALRLGWYKVYKPLEFYCAYFTVAPDGFDTSFALLETDDLRRRISEYAAIGMKASAKEEDTLTAMQILLEMRLRGLEILPVDLKRSDAHKFLPEDGKMRLPLISMPGVGATAAENIAEAMRGEEIYSLSELQQKSGVSKTVIATLDENGALAGMPKTNQISLF